jgi:hypothetical protein
MGKPRPANWRETCIACGIPLRAWAEKADPAHPEKRARGSATECTRHKKGKRTAEIDDPEKLATLRKRQEALTEKRRKREEERANFIADPFLGWGETEKSAALQAVSHAESPREASEFLEALGLRHANGTPTRLFDPAGQALQYGQYGGNLG